MFFDYYVIVNTISLILLYLLAYSLYDALLATFLQLPLPYAHILPLLPTHWTLTREKKKWNKEMKIKWTYYENTNNDMNTMMICKQWYMPVKLMHL